MSVNVLTASSFRSNVMETVYIRKNSHATFCKLDAFALCFPESFFIVFLVIQRLYKLFLEEYSQLVGIMPSARRPAVAFSNVFPQ